MLGWVSGIEYDGGGTNHGSRIERGSNATLGMVAHEQPAKLKPRVAHGLAGHRPLPDFSISILEVARAGSRTEVTPFANHAVAKKTIVSLVGPTLEVDVGNFAADFTMWSNHRCPLHACTHADGGMCVDEHRALDVASSFECGARTNHDGAVCGIQCSGLYLGAVRDENVGRCSKDVGRCNGCVGLQVPIGLKSREVTLQLVF